MTTRSARFSLRMDIATAAVKRGLPILITGAPAREPTAAGILFSYCLSQKELFKSRGIDRTLGGAKPADIPVEQPSKEGWTNSTS